MTSIFFLIYFVIYIKYISNILHLSYFVILAYFVLFAFLYILYFCIRPQAITQSGGGDSMSDDDKLAWALDVKDKANELYATLKFDEAAKLYNDCLVAMDLEGTESQTAEVAQKLQLPVCTKWPHGDIRKFFLLYPYIYTYIYI